MANYHYYHPHQTITITLPRHPCHNLIQNLHTPDVLQSDSVPSNANTQCSICKTKLYIPSLICLWRFFALPLRSLSLLIQLGSLVFWMNKSFLMWMLNATYPWIMILSNFKVSAMSPILVHSSVNIRWRVHSSALWPLHFMAPWLNSQ